MSLNLFHTDLYFKEENSGLNEVQMYLEDNPVFL